MTKFCLLLTFLWVVPTNIAAQNKDVSLKIGGSYFINCKRSIAFGEQSVMNVTGDDKTGRKVQFDIFSSRGTLDASLKDGKFTGANATFYSINTFAEGFTIADTRDHRIVLKIISVENKAEKRTDLHVWADFFLPNGNRFQCTPDDCNVPILQMMKGSTFINQGTAVQLD